MTRVYFDNAATTPMSGVALAAFTDQARAIGNPSSLHGYGRSVRKELECARESIAAVIGAHSSEVIFTGSGTEADNLAIKGIFWQRRSENNRRKVVVISAIEHHAVLDPARWLADVDGAELIELPVNREGVLNLEFLSDLVARRGDEIALISVMHANNEIGTLQPIKKIVEIANSKSIPVHTDAVQSLGKVAISFSDLGVFAMTLSAHKIGGPVGVGALILRKGMEITPLLHGGGQERDIRSGTFNAAGIVSFAAAVQSADRDREKNYAHFAKMRDALIEVAVKTIPGSWVNGVVSERSLPSIVNIGFPNTESDSLLLLFDNEGIACSTGSACSAGVQQPSHVLLALGRNEREARSSLRFSFGPQNSASDIEYFQTCLSRVIERAQAAYKASA
jgi:cysteine desulfurase